MSNSCWLPNNTLIDRKKSGYGEASVEKGGRELYSGLTDPKSCYIVCTVSDDSMVPFKCDKAISVQVSNIASKHIIQRALTGSL
jgi:hypothetical protein